MSTSWNAMRAPNARSMINEITKMGFRKIELNFTLTSKDICDIIFIKDREGIEITSLHNFCPIPKGVRRERASPDYYSLSSLDEGERKKAIDATKTTIETAAKLNARVVILHTGGVEIKDKTKRLAAVLDDKPRYEELKSRMLKERAENSPDYFAKALSSIEELLAFTKKQDVLLGIENRYYYSEIPSIDEMGILLDRFNDEHIGYWHDVGHAQIFENIGLFEHKDYLDRFSSRMIGIHLHDITGTQDHLAPLQGGLDFSILKPYVRKDMLLVLEPHYPATSDQIRKGAEYLASLFGGTQ